MNRREGSPRGALAVVVGLVVIVLLSAAQAQDQAVVATDGTPLQLSREAQEAAAELYVTTHVEVLEEEGDLTRVATTGWAELDDEGNPDSVLYTNDSDLIRVADAPDPSVFPVEEQHEEWVEYELEGWVPSDALAPDTEELYAEASDVYQQFCTGCHTGYARPVEQIRSQMPPEMLPDIAHRMARGTGIPDDQLNLIIHWLQDTPE